MPDASSRYQLLAQNKAKEGIVQRSLAMSFVLYKRIDVGQPEGLKENGARQANLKSVERRAQED